MRWNVVKPERIARYLGLAMFGLLGFLLVLGLIKSQQSPQPVDWNVVERERMWTQFLDAFDDKEIAKRRQNDNPRGVQDIHGVVTCVHENGELLTISLGSEDDVFEGKVYQVWRINDVERKYLGQIKIFVTRPNEAAATVDVSLGTIRPGDRVCVPIVGLF